MKASIGRDGLLRAAKKALSLVNTSEDSKYCRVDLGECGATIYARNKTSQLELTLPCEVRQAGSFGISTKKLARICDAARSEFIEFSKTKTGKIRVKASGSVANMANIEIEKTQIATEETACVGGAEIWAAIELAGKYASKNEARRNMMGVNIESSQGTLEVTGSDGFTALRRVISMDGDQGSALIAGESIKEIKGFFDEGSKIYIGESSLIIESAGANGMKYKTPLMQAKFPNLDQILAPQAPPVAISLTALKEKIDFLTAWDDVAAHGEMPVKMTFSIDGLRVASRDNAEDDDIEPIGVDGELDIAIGLNAALLSKALASLAEVGEKLPVSISSDVKPVIFREEKTNTTIAVMPMRLKW